MIFLLLISFLGGTFAVAPNYYPQYSTQPNYSNKVNVPIVSESNEISPDGTFAYSYSTGDGQNVQAQGYLKNAGNKDTEAEVIQGSYSYTSPEGTIITVNYIADEFGFRAEGAHLPTPPPIPEAIQRSLELIAQAQGRSGTVPTSYPEQRSYKSNYRSQYNRPYKY
ncbi:endocuticle structural glycoprotein SgAbd-2-like [Diabrotica undecimpunctata]|uniref:endocuticle structural glycoprotein SgAbd-2-like n=1 Tax=Diabrotica undecimpunctata TaxID=50387 RepID=UPI003B63B5EB